MLKKIRKSWNRWSKWNRKKERHVLTLNQASTKVATEPALTEEQKRLVDQIMEQSNPQNRVDKMVIITQVLQRENAQAKVDKMVAEELAKIS